MDSRLSSLPDDIIYKILSTVPMKDVIRTSVLSSRWRYVWASMPYLIFSTSEFCLPEHAGAYFPEFTRIVEHVLSLRNNQVPVSSVKLDIYGDVCPWEIEILLLIKYILSHNVQQLDVECMLWNYLPDWANDDSDLLVFSSESLKRLSLTMEYPPWPYLTASSNLELPALMTLYLSHVELYGDDNTLFSKCPNLKSLTLKSCKTQGSDSLSIFHHRLSNLTLEHDRGSATVVNVVAPQLENLTILYRFTIYQLDEMFYAHDTTYNRDCLREYKHLISAPNLISLIYEGYDPLPLSTDGFHSLEKVDLCICDISQEAAEALEIVRLFQQIQSVKFLTLNLEILELLSSYVRVISHHPPPFANLKSLDIYPKMVNAWETPKDITEVKNYLLDSSQGATFTMVSRQEAIADMNATQARLRMADWKRYLDTEKDIFETIRDHMQQPTESMYNDDDNGEPETQMQLQIRKITKQMKSCWIDHEKLSSRGKQIVNKITSYLEVTESIVTKLPASKRAMLQPCFSSLCAETNIFVSKMTEPIKIHVSENLSSASDCFHELLLHCSRLLSKLL
ncbi:F-box domain containing protein [Tanacetum coccineum]